MNDLAIIESFERGLIDGVDPERASSLRSLYETLATQLFWNYEPSRSLPKRSARDFLLRLNAWLSCFETDSERWVAFKSIEYIFYAGEEDFVELYRCAYEDKIQRALVDFNDMDIFSDQFVSELAVESQAIWVCPLTDSLRINSFLHCTGMPSQSLRPDIMSLMEFGDEEKINSYCKNEKIKYIAIVEDFIGTGSQALKSLKKLEHIYKDPIVIVPLVICKPGYSKIMSWIETLDRDNIRFSPVLIIEDNCMVKKTPSEGEPLLFSALRGVMKSGFDKIGIDLGYGEYGWKDTGSMVVMYSNCPNNTPPIYHATSEKWAPIFPRSDRTYRSMELPIRRNK